MADFSKTVQHFTTKFGEIQKRLRPFD